MTRLIGNRYNILNFDISKGVFDITADPTGFVNRTDSIISFDDGTESLTLSGTFDYYIHGIKYSITGSQSVAILGQGKNYFYLDSDGILNVTQTFSINNLFKNNTYVAVIYWDDTNSENIYMGDERHSIFWNWSVHAYEHLSEGARYLSGLGFGNIVSNGTGDDNSNIKFSVDSGKIADEDLFHDIDARAISDNIPVYYRSGESGYWSVDDSRPYPVLNYDGGSGRLAWNEYTGGSWQQTEVNTLDTVNAHIFATNDPNRPIIAIQGQITYLSLVAARQGAPNELLNLSLGDLPFEEYTPLGTFIFETFTGFSNDAKARIRTTDDGDDYIDFRTIKGTGSGGNSEDHGNYEDRGDASAYDFAVGDLTTDGNWNQLDLSTIIPSGTKLVIISASLNDDTIGDIKFRTNGNSNGINVGTIKHHIATEEDINEILVKPDSNQIIQYNATNKTWTQINIIIRGWFV